MYCRNHGYTAIRHYNEDGSYSETNFNRPSFQRMIADIEAGKVKCVITKDDCVIIERKHRKPQKNAGFVVSVLFFDPKQRITKAQGGARRVECPQSNRARLHRAGIAVGEIQRPVSALFFASADWYIGVYPAPPRGLGYTPFFFFP